MDKHDVFVPAHLRQYVASQDYNAYTSIDHAVWRYVMRRNVDFLGEKAHSAYIHGLHAAGIQLDSVPNVVEMNESLAKLGWGAVVVDGLIPGVAFFDFQAHGILPISVDIRTLEHIEYTPAPDIIHEAAGHAPILFDEKYAEYVRIFGEIGAKALGTKEGHDVFDAVRNLTKVMENPASSLEQIEEAKRCLTEKQLASKKESEESLVSRLYWWTVEYGLIGSVDEPIIYGAGLLSSVKEGKHCLTDSVRKLPFDLETCIQTRYDVTKPQPQLFVCKDFDQLIGAVHELANRMAFRVGGTRSLHKAIDSGRTATVEYSSGLQVSGTLTEIIHGANGEAVYIKTTGPTALATAGKGLSGHGRTYHTEGFGSPIGKLKGTSKPLENFSEADLTDMQICMDNSVQLTFESGIIINGTVESVLRERDRVILISFANCSVTFQNEVLFDPKWGRFDMAVGETITSVFAGAADPESFFDKVAPPLHSALADMPDHSRALIELYQQVRDLRRHTDSNRDVPMLLNVISDTLDVQYPSDWLLRLELLELTIGRGDCQVLRQRLNDRLTRLQVEQPELQELIDNGIELLSLPVKVTAQ
jgi:phenylalanine-4-hydroxylase